MENAKMEHDLVETMKSLSLLTKELIKIIESDDYSDLEDILNKRQKEIDSLKDLGCTKEEYIASVEKFGLNSLQQKLFRLMEDKKIELKEKLNDLSKNKVVANSYNHNNLVGAKIFSKKI
jgi:hypothetical protein